MTIATIAKEKKKRGFDSLLNQFSEIGKTAMNAAPAFAKTATETVRRMPVKQSLTERLNLMIASGASFDVSKDDFQVVSVDSLTETERQFLAVNKIPVLCTLQQSLLMKYLPLDYIPRLTDEINERTAILSDGEAGEPPFEIVRDVTEEWFADLLEEMTKEKL